MVSLTHIKKTQCIMDYNNKIKQFFINDQNHLSNESLAVLDINNLPKFHSFAIENGECFLIDENKSKLQTSPIQQKQLKQWLDALNGGGLRFGDLQLDLLRTCADGKKLAIKYCLGDHMNLNGCAWYHSVWQYLRLFDMVSTPGWHADFYLREIYNATKGQSKNKVLISGCADYSMYYFLCRGLADIENTEIDVLDMCMTPLIMTEQYALYKHNQKINIIQKHIFDLSQNGYDLITTDAFLTRFKEAELRNLLKTWYKALRDGGKVITTMRYYEKGFKHGDPSEKELESFMLKFYDRYDKWSFALKTSKEELEPMVRTYALSMKSSNLGKLEDILRIMKEVGFSIELTEKTIVQGELYPSEYCRLVLRK